jgi:phosphoribosyl 1,2-cyclic phosphate phosphodiesterase
LKNKFTILGCGSSLGAPWINNYWGNCDKKNKRNLRTRCCAHFQYKNISTLIDTSPDLKTQFQKNNITNLDAVIYTHEHADQTSGIFELRPFFWKNKKKINIYGSKKL